MEDEKKYYESFNENNERADIIINNLENYLDQAEADIQSVISDYALEYLYNTLSWKQVDLNQRAPLKAPQRVVQKRNLWHFHKINQGQSET